MIHPNAEPSSAPLSLKFATAATSLLLLSGCHPGTESQPTPSDIVTTQPSGAELPESACEWPSEYEPSEVKEAKARRCADAMVDGTVAFVVFDGVGKTDDELKIAGDEVESLISTYSEGSIRVTVDVMKASDAAEATFAAGVGGAACVDGGIRKTQGAMVADRTMPELRKYDFVLGAVPLKNCDPNTQGRTFDGRHADIYAGGKLRELRNRTDVLASPFAFASAHELGHEFGLGHNGDADIRHLSFGGTVDVAKLVAGAKYYEVGTESSLMSNNFYPHYVFSDPVQLDQLRWPQQVLGKESPSAIPVANTPTVIKHEKATESQYFKLELDQPVNFQNSSVDFGQLVLAPDTRGVRGSEGFDGVKVGLVDSRRNVVWFDVPFEQDDSRTKSTMTLVFGAQRVQMEIGTGGKSISARVL